MATAQQGKLLARVSQYSNQVAICIRVLDGKDPAEGDGGQCATDHGPNTVTNREEEEQHRLLPVVVIERAGIGHDNPNHLRVCMSGYVKLRKS